MPNPYLTTAQQIRLLADVKGRLDEHVLDDGYSGCHMLTFFIHVDQAV